MLAHPLAILGCGVFVASAIWLLCWAARFMVGLFLDHPMVTLRSEAAAGSAEATPPAQEPPVRFLSRDGVELSGWLVKSSVPTRRVIVFFHEFGADASAWSRYLGWAPSEGYHVFTFDFRGSGASLAPQGYRSHKWVTAGEVGDADAALRHIRARAMAEGWDVLGFGASRGAAAMMIAAVAHPWLSVLACEGMSSTMGSIRAYAERWASIWVPPWMARRVPSGAWRVLAHLVIVAAQDREGVLFPPLEEHLRSLDGRRVFFLYGARDSLIDAAQRSRILASFPGERQVWIMPGAGHLAGPAKFAVEYGSLLRDWYSGGPSLGCRLLAVRPACPDPSTSSGEAAPERTRRGLAPAPLAVRS